LAKGLTLGQVAATTNLTEGYVSKLERDQVSPSVASLIAVCGAVGLRVGDLFEPPTTKIVRAGEGAKIKFGGDGVREYLLSNGTQRQIEVLHSVIEPGGSGGDQLYSLNCETEFVLVISGSLQVIFGNEVISLSRGDALTFRGNEPHTWRNPSKAR
jgi:transcriptional regulator with XRE-family HTH domain